MPYHRKIGRDLTRFCQNLPSVNEIHDLVNERQLGEQLPDLKPCYFNVKTPIDY